MLHISTYVAPSAIHGLGVFAANDIAKDTLIWTFEESFDRRYTEKDFKALHPSIHEFYKIYGYQDIQDGLYYMTIDNDRYTNHSDFPNTYFDDAGRGYAMLDILKGQEITSDYRDFIADWERHFPLLVKDFKNECRQTA